MEISYSTNITLSLQKVKTAKVSSFEAKNKGKYVYFSAKMHFKLVYILSLTISKRQYTTKAATGGSGKYIPIKPLSIGQFFV